MRPGDIDQLARAEHIAQSSQYLQQSQSNMYTTHHESLIRRRTGQEGSQNQLSDEPPQALRPAGIHRNQSESILLGKQFQRNKGSYNKNAALQGMHNFRGEGGTDLPRPIIEGTGSSPSGSTSQLSRYSNRNFLLKKENTPRILNLFD